MVAVARGRWEGVGKGLSRKESHYGDLSGAGVVLCGGAHRSRCM